MMDEGEEDRDGVVSMGQQTLAGPPTVPLSTQATLIDAR